MMRLMDMKKRFWLPTIPLSLIDCINRQAAATGSIRYAMQAGNADYNGHHIIVHFNDYRGYWLAEYCWAGRVVLSRGDLESALRAGLAEHRRGARGTEVVTDELDAEGAALAQKLGYQEYTDACYPQPQGLFAEIHGAFDYEKHFGVPATGFLANSKTVEEYRAKVEEFLAERRPQPKKSNLKLEEIG